MVTTISRDELWRKVNGGDPLVIAEALPERYFSAEHLPGAVNLPHDQVADLAPELLPDREAEVVVYCANAACKNSQAAAEALIELGYSRVRKYAEGKQDWIDAGLPVEGTRAQRAS